MLYRHCYIPSFQAQAVAKHFIQLYAKNDHRNIMKRTTNSHQIDGNQKRQYYRRAWTKNSNNRVFDCQLSPDWRQLEIEKHWL